MSYSIDFGVKPEGSDIFVRIASPQLDMPTYNLGDIFRTSMKWYFKIDTWYKLPDVYQNILDGVEEVKANRDKYKKLEAPNGWGTVQDAIDVMESIIERIDDLEVDEIPIDVLWIKW